MRWGGQAAHAQKLLGVAVYVGWHTLKDIAGAIPD